MKALTLTQPWASLMSFGDKTIETRSWRTDYRGPVAIHAAKTIPAWARDWANGSPAVRTMLNRRGVYQLSELPAGAVIATAVLTGCVSTDRLVREPPGKDRILGDYSPGRFAWYFTDVVRLPEPIPARGALQFWEWDETAHGVEVLQTGRLPLEME